MEDDSDIEGPSQPPLPPLTTQASLPPQRLPADDARGLRLPSMDQDDEDQDVQFADQVHEAPTQAENPFVPPVPTAASPAPTSSPSTPLPLTAQDEPALGEFPVTPASRIAGAASNAGSAPRNRQPPGSAVSNASSV